MPELLAVTPTPIGALGQHHFRMHNTRLVGEIMAAAKPLIMQPRGRTVGRSGDSAAADSAGNDLCREMVDRHDGVPFRSEEHTSELQSLMRISYAVFCLKKKKQTKIK